MKLVFNNDEHGIKVASPISYECCMADKGEWLAYVIEHINAECGYLNADGAVVCSFNQYPKLPEECKLQSENDAIVACQKHMDNFMGCIYRQK